MQGIREMGKSFDIARDFAPEHAAVLDDLKDQLLIVLLKRVADAEGRVRMSVAEVDNSGRYFVAFTIVDGRFDFLVTKKD